MVDGAFMPRLLDVNSTATPEPAQSSPTKVSGRPRRFLDAHVGESLRDSQTPTDARGHTVSCEGVALVVCPRMPVPECLHGRL